MSGLSKLKWFLAVLGVFLLILATNLIDRRNFLRVEESVERIYDQRLLAKELLLNVSVQFHKKELAYARNDRSYLDTQNAQVNAEITDLLTMFNRAEATKKERIILDKLNRNHTKLIQLEAALNANDAPYNDDFAEVFSDIISNIEDLAKEQVEEARKQKIDAVDAVDIVKLFSKIEIYMLITLGLVLQFIILYSPGKKS